MSKLTRILCIDDDQDILALVKAYLEKRGGYEVITCESGPDALHSMREMEPDLILLDAMIPGMDGPAIIRTFQKTASLHMIPIIFVTARATEKNVREYLDAGAAAVIAKPFDPEKLPGIIQSIWDKRHVS